MRPVEGFGGMLSSLSAGPAPYRLTTAHVWEQCGKCSSQAWCTRKIEHARQGAMRRVRVPCPGGLHLRRQLTRLRAHAAWPAGRPATRPPESPCAASATRRRCEEMRRPTHFDGQVVEKRLLLSQHTIEAATFEHVVLVRAIVAVVRASVVETKGCSSL